MSGCWCWSRRDWEPVISALAVSLTQHPTGTTSTPDDTSLDSVADDDLRHRRRVPREVLDHFAPVRCSTQPLARARR